MNILRQNLLPFFLLAFSFALITAFAFICAAAPAGIKIIGGFIVSLLIFAAFQARYARLRSRLNNLQESMVTLNHDIRSPLTTICGIAEIFAATQDGLTPKQKELALTLSSGAAELKVLIARGLSFSSAEKNNQS